MQDSTCQRTQSPIVNAPIDQTRPRYPVTCEIDGNANKGNYWIAGKILTACAGTGDRGRFSYFDLSLRQFSLRWLCSEWSGAANRFSSAVGNAETRNYQRMQAMSPGHHDQNLPRIVKIRYLGNVRRYVKCVPFGAKPCTTACAYPIEFQAHTAMQIGTYIFLAQSISCQYSRMFRAECQEDLSARTQVVAAYRHHHIRNHQRKVTSQRKRTPKRSLRLPLHLAKRSRPKPTAASHNSFHPKPLRNQSQQQRNQFPNFAKPHPH